jgi:hypothetical protein
MCALKMRFIGLGRVDLNFHRCLAFTKIIPTTFVGFFDSLWRGPEANTVAHLHGVYNDARKIILTATQYALAYGGSHEDLTLIQPPRPSGVRTVLQKAVGALMAMTHGKSHNASGLFQPTMRSNAWTLLRRTVWALMATQRLIFVGFGMNDPFLYALFSYVSGDLWDTTGQIHYFVTGVSNDTNKDPDIDRRRLLLLSSAIAWEQLSAMKW